MYYLIYLKIYFIPVIKVEFSAYYYYVTLYYVTLDHKTSHKGPFLAEIQLFENL